MFQKMNRELKFRAWDTELRKWVFFTLEEALINKDKRFALFLEHYCEYTGLKDKNGKEIYVGDVLNHKEGDVVDQTVKVIADHESLAMLEQQLDLWEIVGNIYENPELIK